MSRLPPILSKLLALALLLAVIGLVWLAAVRPLTQSFVDLAERRVELESLRDRYLAAAGQREARERELEAMRLADLEIEGMIDAPNSAVAAAQMQTEVTDAIAASGGVVRRVTVLPSDLQPRYEKIGLLLLFNANIEGLRDLLAELEIDGEAYQIGDMQIQGARGEQNVANKITVQMEVFGYRRVEPPQTGGDG